MPKFLTVARVACALILGAAGLMKLLWPDSLSASEQAAVPDLVNLISRMSPWFGALEITLAALLLQRSVLWQRRAASLAAGIVGLGVLYLIWLRASSQPVDRCGCFGAALQLDLGKHLALSGVLLALLTLVVFTMRDPRSADAAP